MTTNRTKSTEPIKYVDLVPCRRCGNTAGEMIDEIGCQWGRCRPCGIDYMLASKWNSLNQKIK